MNDKLTVCWLSAGVSSFVAGDLIKDEIDKFIYIDIDSFLKQIGGNENER